MNDQKTKKSLLTSMKQAARKFNVPEEQAEATVDKVLALQLIASVSKQMLGRIGVALIAPGHQIVAPACPDYTHHNGRYTFRGVNGGVSLLTQLHIDFLKKVSDIIPECPITILIADHEADDRALCDAVGKSGDEFRSLILSSVKATAKLIGLWGWEAKPMTKVIPDLTAREQLNIAYINGQPDYNRRIENDTAARISMYKTINPGFSLEEMRQRTIITAAQYLAFGQVAVDRNWIVCNHSTVNLCWYKEVGAAVLHNDVSVY